MKIFSFSWKEVVPHLPSKRFIVAAEHRREAMRSLLMNVPRVARYFKLDETGDFGRLTSVGQDHHFSFEEYSINHGTVVILNLT